MHALMAYVSQKAMLSEKQKKQLKIEGFTFNKKNKTVAPSSVLQNS